ncbi:LOW QUALITY PROTEIN: uncharacterized protein LOC117896997 [Drosophila subobscura]|uniref:LOW QUALITY PROTEIN: uncharacterized protein LOC117896997 n=1 Tax=Drosophila subobscura TaxID=7241 RepID=UPI00155A99C9|nr:LOW QUALITY PROTEIN: uncharacterized protein LOC117896997 [Drosophila subobscura]
MTQLSAAAMLILQLVVPVLLLLQQLSTCSAVSQIVDNFDGLADGSYMTSRSSSRPQHSFDMHYDNSNTDSDSDSDSNSIGSANNETRILRRGKRYLQFSKGSRMSWRTNGKNTLLKINTLYAYGYGFRTNYPFPSIEEQKKDNAVFFRLFKRDLFSKLETALDGHGFDGRACMLKSFCTAVLDVDKAGQKSGMLFKLLKLVFSRAKRYLDIIETTRIFVGIFDNCISPIAYRVASPLFKFRVNAKNNVIASPIVWAHGYGFRANTPVLVKRENRPFRRDTYELLHELIDRSGLDGRACVLKAYCTALAGDHGQGFLFKLLKYVFTLDEHEKRHMPHLREQNCEQIMHSHCPLSFDSISPYTDDV